MRCAAGYRPDIDGLRGIAVLAVFVFHLNRRWLPGGFFGVDVFFVISGYLITSIILRDCGAGRFRFGQFYQRRIARLLPAFASVATATIAGAAAIYSPQDLASAGATLSAAAASGANLKFLLQGNYFHLSPDAQPFLHCWSLSVEEQFYLLFPALLLWCRRTWVLAAIGAVSLGCYLVLRPEWAFYLLPARAWELLAGAIVAKRDSQSWLRPPFSRLLPLVVIAVSFATGRFAILTVIGTAGLLTTELPVLSWKPLVFVGRMSYSLYLWHWPVFSLVDYACYWQSPALRLALKVTLSFSAAAACFVLIERPGRRILNAPSRGRVAFAALACSLAALIPLGLVIRSANYVNAGARAVRGGGLRFNPGGRNGSMVLMGDSNGSMYGKMAREIARERDLRLAVISVEAGDPLPRSNGQNPQLWDDSLAVVRRERPDFLLLACNWNKLADDRGRLTVALRELKPFARNILLITQPPVLPENATREAIREGNRPPFREDAAERAARLARNALVKSAAGGNVRVIDIEPLFTGGAGEIRFAGERRRLLYQDRDHLSAAGAEIVKPELLRAMNGLTASR
ncbi:MAG TPA: acyltransferase family protein [Bryobacteraceae bacterium]|nr:acyltransferase family protein [Bryobacteraceae bacterium]